MERTFVFIKPDAVKNNFVGQILSVFELNGIRLVNITMAFPEIKTIERHYGEHKGREYYDRLIDFSMLGPIVLMILEAENAVERVRNLVGATDPSKANKGSIRNLYGEGVPNNGVHASDSKENAEREIKIWNRFFNFK